MVRMDISVAALVSLTTIIGLSRDSGQYAQDLTPHRQLNLFNYQSWLTVNSTARERPDESRIARRDFADNEVTASRNTYYVNAGGNDQAAGDRLHPFKTLNALRGLALNPGDSIFLQGGQTFPGNIALDSISGKQDEPVVLSSVGPGMAIVDGGRGSAITITHASFISVNHLLMRGRGRKQGNTASGLSISNAAHIDVDSVDISGFQKSGLSVYASRDITVNHVFAHDNGFAGISVSGDKRAGESFNVTIQNSKAQNNPGDPTELHNHSGNGIIAGNCHNVLIDHCTATNNGWDMPRKGNGPVGIWCYEADSVVIQYCVSYANKTSRGGKDGGGFDFDGGTTHSVIQHCSSYDNQGSGYGVFQYSGASRWHDNTIRFCMSKNDGNVSPAHAGVFIWNETGDSTQLSNLTFINNIIDNEKGAVISYEKKSDHAGFQFLNNTFIVRKDFFAGKRKPAIFRNNRWIKK